MILDIVHAFINCVRETFNHELSPSEVDWGGNLKLNNTSSGCMLMEVDWGGKLKLNYTSCGCMLMKVDWGGKLIVNSMVNWGGHETHQNEHSTTRVHSGDHDPSLNRMDEYSISKVDWGVHDSSYFLYLVYIDLDAKPKDFFTLKISSPKCCGEDYHKGDLPPLS